MVPVLAYEIRHVARNVPSGFCVGVPTACFAGVPLLRYMSMVVTCPLPKSRIVWPGLLPVTLLRSASM